MTALCTHKVVNPVLAIGADYMLVLQPRCMSRPADRSNYTDTLELELCFISTVQTPTDQNSSLASRSYSPFIHSLLLPTIISGYPVAAHRWSVNGVCGRAYEDAQRISLQTMQ